MCGDVTAERHADNMDALDAKMLDKRFDISCPLINRVVRGPVAETMTAHIKRDASKCIAKCEGDKIPRMRR